MATPKFDSKAYTQLPIFDVSGATALATSLNSALPKGISAPVKTAAREMMTAAAALAKAWRDEQNSATDERRPAHLAIGRAWSAFSARLDTSTSLPVEHYPQASRAREVSAILFPDGLTFLRLPFNQEWAESDKRLKQIEVEGLTKSIKDLIGLDFLEQVQRTHEVSGRVLGITKPSPAAQVRLRGEKLRALRKAMNRYVFNVLGQVDEEDSAMMEMIRDALHPIDAFRAGAAARRQPAQAEAAESTSGGPAPAFASPVQLIADDG